MFRSGTLAFGRWSAARLVAWLLGCVAPDFTLPTKVMDHQLMCCRRIRDVNGELQWICIVKADLSVLLSHGNQQPHATARCLGDIVVEPDPKQGSAVATQGAVSWAHMHAYKSAAKYGLNGFAPARSARARWRSEPVYSARCTAAAGAGSRTFELRVRIRASGRPAGSRPQMHRTIFFDETVRNMNVARYTA